MEKEIIFIRIYTTIIFASEAALLLPFEFFDKHRRTFLVTLAIGIGMLIAEAFIY